MKKKILVLTPRFPYPVIGGDRLRIYHQCKELSRYYEVTLLSLCETKREMDYIIPSDGVFTKVERVFLSKITSYFRAFASAVTSTPLQVAYYRSPGFARKFWELEEGHDLVFSHLIRTAEYAITSKLPKILEMTDAISLNYKRVKEQPGFKVGKALLYEFEQARLERCEREAIKHFEYISFVSDVDREFLYADSKDFHKSFVCGNGVSAKKFPYQFSLDALDKGPYRIVFIGAMTTIQNIDAVTWFARKVMPLLMRQGEFVFEIIGRIGEASAKKLKRLEGVYVVGAVDSVPTVAKGAVVAVCPMRIGAGVQNKVLEYMALGIPCVTSTIGLEGISAMPNKDLLLANGEGEFCSQVLSIVSNPVMAEKMALNSRKVIEESYSWESQLRPLTKVVSELLNSPIQ